MAMQQLVLAALLDDGGRGLARSLAVVGVLLVLALFVAVLVPVAVLTGAGVVPVTPTAAVPSAPPPAGRAPVPSAPPPVGRAPVPLAPPLGRALVPSAPPPVGVPVPSGASSQPVDVALRYLGVPYVFGGTDPAIGLDCSGLVQLVFHQIGAWLPRTAQLQYEATARVPPDQLQPGDLVFFARTYADPHDWITHVGIYLGDGQQLNAPTEGQVVSIQPVFAGFWGAHYAAGGRVLRP
jgi:cell wall-associated NlpC family hydrolase